MILKSIRENEARAISLGYSVARYKLGAFVMSAALAGLAGAIKALVFQFATLTDVTWQMSGEVILMTLLGGIGTMIGPVIGAGLVVTLGNYLATTGFPVTIITGVVFMICVLLFRRVSLASSTPRDWGGSWVLNTGGDGGGCISSPFAHGEKGRQAG